MQSYDVDLDLTRGAESFGSVTTIRFRCLEPGSATFVELTGTGATATLNGRPVATELTDGRLALTDLAADNELVVRAQLPYLSGGEGLHRFVDPADGESTCTACRPGDAPRNFACFDQPDLKAPAADGDVPRGLGRAGQRDRRPRPAPGRWEFAETEPMSTYLFTVVAGPYHSIGEHDGIPLGLACRRSLAEHLESDAEELFDITGQLLRRYHGMFGSGTRSASTARRSCRTSTSARWRTRAA